MKHCTVRRHMRKGKTVRQHHRKIKKGRLREHFQNKENRDARYQELKAQGIDVARGRSMNQLIDPQYVKDSVESDGDSYKTHFPVLYRVEEKRVKKGRLGDPSLSHLEEDQVIDLMRWEGLSQKAATKRVKKSRLPGMTDDEWAEHQEEHKKDLEELEFVEKYGKWITPPSYEELKRKHDKANRYR